MRIATSHIRTRALVCVVAFALWLATTLGFMHRMVHGPLSPHAPAVSAQVADTAKAASAGHSQGGLLELFGAHTDADCRLYDQLSHGSAALCVPPVFLPVMLPAATFAWLEGEALARWVALFDARGPPSTR
ncbi:hypothetical protein QTH97_04750 [Variovorax sp. J22R24]|uniref:hypothetical protein n=1 Tax=Variovorax gracilis TaxID=3053502 RepID=UPI002576EC51|nr:hypothetical protein [Variovorax sp. J22R24]MDM0104230.1 hypothetical protein [Variovorax sp. J22R24]